MTERVDLYGAYADFGHRVLAAIRGDTFGDDIGQNSWTSTDEYERFIAWLEIAPGHHVLEVASGSGGPALHLVRRTGCRLTGVDRDAGAVTTATRLVSGLGASDRLRFLAADANAGLPFAAGTFDALLCVDAVNHLPDRAGVLGEWRRVLRPGGRALFTDPVVVTGPVTNEELAIRSSIGRFLFVPPGVNERLIAEAGLRLVHQEDRTGAVAQVAERWHRARAARREDLVTMEGAERCAGLQRFLHAVHVLARERRLSRFVYVVENPA